MTQKRKKVLVNQESTTKSIPDDPAAPINSTSLIVDCPNNDSVKKIAWEISQLGLTDDQIKAAAALARNESIATAAKDAGLHRDTVTMHVAKNDNFNAAVGHFRRVISAKFLDIADVIAMRARKEIEDGEAKDALGFSKLVTETMGHFRDQQIKEVAAAASIKSTKFFDDDND